MNLLIETCAVRFLPQISGTVSGLKHGIVGADTTINKLEGMGADFDRVEIGRGGRCCPGRELVRGAAEYKRIQVRGVSPSRFPNLDALDTVVVCRIAVVAELDWASVQTLRRADKTNDRAEIVSIQTDRFPNTLSQGVPHTLHWPSSVVSNGALDVSS